MTYDEWCNPRFSEMAGVRRGQHLFNTAPLHVGEAVRGVMGFDPFYNNQNIPRFAMLAYLVWDITDPDEIQEAIKLVRKELPLEGKS